MPTGAKLMSRGDFYSMCCPELHYMVNGAFDHHRGLKRGAAIIEMMKLRCHRQRGGLTQRFTFSSHVSLKQVKA